MSVSSFTAKFREIEDWLSNFKKTNIPVDSFEKNFNRSSGPGGQNVNKVRCVLYEYFSSNNKLLWGSIQTPDLLAVTCIAAKTHDEYSMSS